MLEMMDENDIPIVLNGDIRTRTVKRKSAYSTWIGKNDTHKHDKVAVTQQAVRYVRGRLHFGTEIDSPPASPTRAFARDHLPTDVGPSTGGKHDTIPQTPRTDPSVPVWNPLHELPEQPARVTVTSDVDGDDGMGDYRTEHQPVNLVQTKHQSAKVAVTADVDVDEGNVHDRIQHQLPQQPPAREAVNHVQTAHRAVRVDVTPEVYAHEDIGHDQTAHPVHTISSDTYDKALSDTSSEVEIIESTPRQRPPTRARPVFQQPLLGPVQYGIQVTEREVNMNNWHMSRTTTTGSRPACFTATPGRSTPCALCKTKIRHAGLVRHGVGVVAPSFIGKHKYMAIERDYRYWFCPNGRCHKGPRANSCKTQMPMVPDIMPVQRGTHLTQEEVDFLTKNGFTLVQRPDANMNQRDTFPTEAEIKVLVEAYPEEVHSHARNFRFKTSGGRRCRQKTTPSTSCLKRLERARSSQMRLIQTWEVPTVTGTANFSSGENPSDQRHYIVRVCCFPSCSCKDFWEREVRLQTYVACKHIYWVFLNVFGLLPSADKIHQPVLTLEEVDVLMGQPNRIG
ncbi:hypothetical protein R1sor_001491 [Riccia sorocarpa]|uniref:SWIM-type domain-containing protein n=1 Tax=Riccia sorocarpa TaxID=122646 RepID=A0ABD3H016_9MARC